ncbi:MAG: T9SS type A sorting domain-containing protein, partial [Bacteroidales bacterium]|nr:T9SS type A sorting domain-containing protein [Bacteroidales bacterium]
YSNLSPYLISAINDIELSKNDTTFTIISNLNQIFKDIDDDILSFSVASDHDELAAVIENDTSLKITASALFDGTATIQVKASDNLLSAMDEFTIHFEMNKAPIKKKTIPDFEITELNTNQTVVEDLSEYFSDPNNDEITFTVSSDNDSISTRILNNSELLIKATKEFKSDAEVTVTASDGELSTEQTFIVTYQTSSIIDEITFVEQSVLIYPNPANEYINLKLYHDDFGKVDISIYDISGKLLLFQQFNKQGIEFEKNINLNNLSNGLYFIEISINNNLIPREIFIKN